MRVAVEDVSSVKKRVQVVLPREDVERELNASYVTARKQARIKGFRPGKAPMSMIERLYKEEVENEVAAKLIGESYAKALEEQDLRPIGNPAFEKGTLSRDEDFSYTAVVEIPPQVDVKDYFGLELEKEERPVTEEQVSERLERIRQSHAQLVSAGDRPVGEGDTAVIDYEQFSEGTPEGEGKRQGIHIEVGKGVVPDLENGLLGLSRDEERKLEIAYPADYPAAAYAGRTVMMQVRVMDIKEKRLPELDDEFAKDLGSGLESMEALRRKVRDDLLEQERRRVQASLNKQIVDRLLSSHPFEVPEILVEYQLESMVENYEKNLARRGLSLEAAGLDSAQLRESYRSEAAERVRTAVLLNKIAEREGIEVTEEDLDEGYGRIAEQVAQTREFVRSLYQKNRMVEGYKSQLLEEKVLKRICDHATIKTGIFEEAKGPEEAREG